MTIIAQLKEQFDVDAEAGAVYSKRTKERLGKRMTGHYRVIYFNQRWVPEHQIIWAVHFGEWPSTLIDHINGVTFDNRITNLRLASPSQNQANAKLREDNTSGIKGVSKIKYGWASYLSSGGQVVHRKTHLRLADAIIARREAVQKHFGEFANKSEFMCSSLWDLWRSTKLLASLGCSADEIMRVCDCHRYVAEHAIAWVKLPSEHEAAGHASPADQQRNAP
jgi:hypothetical protein